MKATTYTVSGYGTLLVTTGERGNVKLRSTCSNDYVVSVGGVELNGATNNDNGFSLKAYETLDFYLEKDEEVYVRNSGSVPVQISVLQYSPTKV